MSMMIGAIFVFLLFSFSKGRENNAGSDDMKT